MDFIDCCVIGAGVIGLAIGRGLAARGQQVVILDRERQFGEGISSRNSEVIHAGIYYPATSLKALTCVRGKQLLYEYCGEKKVWHRRCGKLIVATESAEEPVLDEIRKKACGNGVDDLEFWSADRVKDAEPEVRATMALFSPSTGIVSSHELMSAYLGDFESDGGIFVGKTRVKKVVVENRGFTVICDVEGEEYRFAARILINSAGLGAQALAKSIEGIDKTSIPPLYLCRGNYFTMSGRSPFDHLIYPVPETSGAGLGVHATIDPGGQVRFGPDVEYADVENYAVSTDRLDQYYAAVRRYFPGLPDDSLSPGYVGIRPKLQGPGEPPADFIIQGTADHGVPGLVQLFGIESPGLTSSLAIADDVIGLLKNAL